MSAGVAASGFFGWRVVWAAFAVAVFGWGVGFYGPPVFLYAIHEARGWPVSLVSAAVTCHFLLGAVVVANLATLHRRFGLVAVTRAAAIAAALGFLGWALAREPWQLFAATLLTGFGWAATGAAAINAMVSPWFARRRPAALSTAYNGASVGGVVLSPLWVVLIAALGFTSAAAAVGALMVLTIWWLSGRYLGRTPAGMGLLPDGDAPGTPALARAGSTAEPLPGAALWRSRRFITLAAATSLGLFAQIGLIAHLFSLVVPALGVQLAGFAAGLATACAIAGRTGMGWLLPPGADRRRALALNYGLQLCGSLVLLTAGGTSIPLLLLGVVLFGLGLGNATSLPPLIVQQDFAPADTARAVALVTACSQACYAFAPGGLRAVARSGRHGRRAPRQGRHAAVHHGGRRPARRGGRRHPGPPGAGTAGSGPSLNTSPRSIVMRVLERLFCNYMWLAWVGLLVSDRGARPEQQPTMPGSSGEACRCLMPDRTILPGW